MHIGMKAGGGATILKVGGQERKKNFSTTTFGKVGGGTICLHVRGIYEQANN